MSGSMGADFKNGGASDEYDGFSNTWKEEAEMQRERVVSDLHLPCSDNDRMHIGISLYLHLSLRKQAVIFVDLT